MSGTSTAAGAIQVGTVLLAQYKLLDQSGTATLPGWVEDDSGRLCPASQVRAGDYIAFMDAADTSYRRIVRTNYDDASVTNAIDLAAPPEGLRRPPPPRLRRPRLQTHRRDPVREGRVS